MNQPDKDFQAAYTDILRSSLLYAKTLLMRNNQIFENVKKATSLLDAISAIPELLFSWDEQKEETIRRRLAYFDSLWVKNDSDFSLMKIFSKHIALVK